MKILEKPIEFLGCYVTDVDVSVGFKSNNSSCSLIMVEDEFPWDLDNTKDRKEYDRFATTYKYYDSEGLPVKNISGDVDDDGVLLDAPIPKRFLFAHANSDGVQLPAARGYDPLFISGYKLPDLGTACIFKIKEKPTDVNPVFTFGGIVQKYVYEETVSAGRRYSIQLETPASFLEGVYIILGGFSGHIYTDDGLPHKTLIKGELANRYEDDSQLLDPTWKEPDIKPLLVYGDMTMQNYPDTYDNKVLDKRRLTPTNIINLYAFKENHYYGGTFLNGYNAYTNPKINTNLKTTGGKYGKADLNSLGYPVKDLVDDITECCKNSLFGGPLKFADTLYKLDIQDLKRATDALGDYRVSFNKEVDVISLINDITGMAMFDYVFTVEEDKDPFDTGRDLLPRQIPKEFKADAYGVLRKARLKLKLIDRREPPDPNTIKNIIEDEKNKPDSEKKLTGFSLGKEVTSDLVTQKVLMGDNVTRHWFANQGHILPIWGQSGMGKNAVYYYGKSVWDYYNPFAMVAITVNANEVGNLTTNSAYSPKDFIRIITNTLELRCALSGKESWVMYHKMFNVLDKKGQTKLNYASPINLMGGVGNLSAKILKDIWDGTKNSHDLFDTSVDTAEVYASYMYGTKDAQIDYLQRQINTRFAAVHHAATHYYGRQFLVAVPSEPGETGYDGIDYNFRWVEFDKEAQTVWKISDDESAWAGEYVTDAIPDVSFYNGAMGRLKAVAMHPVYDMYNYGAKRIQSVLMDYSELGTQYAVFNINEYDTERRRVFQRPVIASPMSLDREWGTRYLDVSTLQTVLGEPLQGPLVEAVGPSAKTPVNKLKLPKDSYITADVTRPPIDSLGHKLVDNYIKGFVKIDTKPVYVYDKYTTEVNAFGVLAQLICGDFLGVPKDVKVTYANMFGSENTDCGISPNLQPPLFVSVPQQSTTHVWGPWWSFTGYSGSGVGRRPNDTGLKERIPMASGSDGRKGKVQIVSDPQIRPENFTSILLMNEQAQLVCDSELQKLHTNETGTIELADIPRWRITDKIYDSGPYINDMHISISADGGVTTRYNFSNWSQRSGKLAVYNYNKMIKSRENNFKYLQEIRSKTDLARLPPVNQKLRASMQRHALLQANNAVNRSSSNGVFGNFTNMLANYINGTNKKNAVNIHSSPIQAAMKAVGFNPMESFGSSWDQLCSPAFIFDQRNQVAAVDLYNERLHLGSTDRGYPGDTSWDGDTRYDKEGDIPPGMMTA